MMTQRLFSILSIILIPTFMFAHGSHGDGMMAGFTHPILGIDHNVAILGSGILGYLVDQKKWYLSPLAFILAMIIGGFMGIQNEATLLIEKIIAFSVFAIGLMILIKSKTNFILLLALLAIFGFFHGYAHGAEMPETNTASKYIPGYTLGAILLAAIGAFVGRTITNTAVHKESTLVVGGIIIGCGIMMLLG